MFLWISIAFLLFQASSSQKGCGKRPFSTRVINGENAKENAWPWQVSLRFNNNHFCGGSLIANNWVLTAAHCFRSTSTRSLTVVVGAHNLRGTTSVQRTFRVKRVIRHEKFNSRTLENDIALLLLQTHINPSKKVNLVCLPRQGNKIRPKTQCFITGWGRTRDDGPLASILQQAKLPIAAPNVCSRRNGPLGRVVQNVMVCAGGNGKGGCQGDSGGPLVCNERGRFFVRGIVSWGQRDCSTSFFTVFTRVSTFINWIRNKQRGS